MVIQAGSQVNKNQERPIETFFDFLGFGLPASYPSLGELALQAKNQLNAPWLGISAFLTFTVMLSLQVFIFEGIRDAFDPRKVFT